MNSLNDFLKRFTEEPAFHTWLCDFDRRSTEACSSSTGRRETGCLAVPVVKNRPPEVQQAEKAASTKNEPNREHTTRNNLRFSSEHWRIESHESQFFLSPFLNQSVKYPLEKPLTVSKHLFLLHFFFYFPNSNQNTEFNIQLIRTDSIDKIKKWSGLYSKLR